MSALTLKTSAGADLFDVSDAGAVTLAGALSAVGLAAGAGTASIASSNGATFTLQTFVGTATLATGGATTTITLASGTLPAGSMVLGSGVRITTTIAGVNSTDGQLMVNGSTDFIGFVSAFTAGTSTGACRAVAVQTADELTFVLSGGADNTPSAGAIKYAVLVMVATGPTA